jgi:hypothetical protein
MMKNKIVISEKNFYVYNLPLFHFWPTSGTLKTFSDKIYYLILVFFDRWEQNNSMRSKWFVITDDENYDGTLYFQSTFQDRPVYMKTTPNRSIEKLPKIENMSLMSNTMKHLSSEDYDILGREFKKMIKNE